VYPSSFDEGNSADLLNRLRNRREDLVVVARAKYNPGFKAVPFAKADFTLVARPDHHLVLKSPVSIKSLSGNLWLSESRLGQS